MFNTVLQKFKRFEVATSELWKTDSNPKLTENFNDRPERNAEKPNRNANERLSETIASVQLFPKRILGEIEKIDLKMPPKRTARHRGDDDSSDSRGKTSHNTNISVCVMDDPLENAVALGPERLEHNLQVSEETDAVALPEPLREVPIQSTALDELCRAGDYLNSISGARERDADLTGMMQLRRELEDMVEEVRLENRLANEENKEIMRNGLRTLGEQIHKERVYFEADRAERLSATKRLREELDALAEEQIKGRRTLEAGLQSVEARILEAITSSRGVPVEPVCTPPRVCESQDRTRAHPTQRQGGLQAVESDSPQPTRLRRNASIDRPSSSSTRLSTDSVPRRVTLISPDRVVDRSTPPQLEPVGRGRHLA